MERVMYSRNNPSPRYQALGRMYREMHTEGEKFLGMPASKTFPGFSLLLQAKRIKRLIDLTGTETILDYGSGKGQQYESPFEIEGEGRVDGVLDYWDVTVECYDPSYEPFSKLPKGTFDGVISTDVLEHCPEEDIPWIIDEIFGYAQKFVFANVACYPARKHLPNGENAHCTIRPPEWWGDIVMASAARRPGVRAEFWVQTKSADGEKLLERRIANFD